MYGFYWATLYIGLQESRAVAGRPRDADHAAVNFDVYTLALNIM